MRIEIRTDNRLGMTQEVLSVLVAQGLDLRNLEVTTNHIYIDLPSLDRAQAPSSLPSALTAAITAVPGVHQIMPIDLLPTERRRLQLHAVLSSLPDPVIAIDTKGDITQANDAAQKIVNKTELDLRGRPLDQLLSQPLAHLLQKSSFQIAEIEMQLGGENFLLHAEPIKAQENQNTQISGSVLVFQRPARLGRTFSALDTKQAVKDFSAILGETPAFLHIKDRAVRLSKVDAPLLILGETGTGKELFARACHESSLRNKNSFLALNCAALPENLAESELFGYAPGAFTSATKGGKPGLLELAHTGTVLLDEIGELTPYLQAKLLRFLQDGSFMRVGGTKEIRVDVRTISATNRNLEEMVTKGTFREDLYYRLNVLSITLPPLRERAGDIPLLAGHFTKRASRQIGCRTPVLSQSLIDQLSAYSWPGNIRQMENALFRAVSLCEKEQLSAVDLELPLQIPTPPSLSQGSHIQLGTSYKLALENFEKHLFTELYPLHPSSRKLAQALGVSHTTVADKLRKYGITLD
ncbi:sigma 54-interacting transcriptional regulator [Kiloniella laminariae]|uniref:sigma 54-interacting transcriptional regulator n=1 Tax=Kiloniella laminariae TaxID=454162 RepID=UPI00036DEA98|nr:sigma 54-interacting transcriptional regulator [Kiloniella laminariae]